MDDESKIIKKLSVIKEIYLGCLLGWMDGKFATVISGDTKGI